MVARVWAAGLWVEGLSLLHGLVYCFLRFEACFCFVEEAPELVGGPQLKPEGKCVSV